MLSCSIISFQFQSYPIISDPYSTRQTPRCLPPCFPLSTALHQIIAESKLTLTCSAQRPSLQRSRSSLAEQRLPQFAAPGEVALFASDGTVLAATDTIKRLQHSTPCLQLCWPCSVHQRFVPSVRDVSDMPWGRLQICVAAVSQKLLLYNIIAS